MGALAVAATVCWGATAAVAQLAVSANDAKVKLIDGKMEIEKAPAPDTVTIIDMRVSPPKVMAELEVPNSVVGPPLNVALTPKEELALVASSQKIDPNDPTKLVADNRLTVLDLSSLRVSLVRRITTAVGVAKSGATPAPKVLATLEAGQGASGIAVNRAGTLALVANREEGTVSVFTIAGGTVQPAGKVKVGAPDSAPSAVAFTPNGKSALVTRTNDHRIVVLAVDGTKVEPTKREIAAGLRPYGLDIAGNGEFAVVGNIGVGGGDADTISIIDLKLDPPRVVGTYTVGQSPEGIKISPDSRYVAVTAQNGSNKSASSPFFNGNSLLEVWTRAGTQLTKVAELPIGRWCQGIAWSSNSRTLLVQCMVEEEINVVRFTGKALQRTGSIKVKGGPAGIRTAEP
jgi:DNA-binding beta-propeller fold protein YncE